MTATIIKRNCEGIKTIHRGRQYKNGLAHGYKAVALIDNALVDLVDLRVSYTSSGTAYACVWMHQPKNPAVGILESEWSSGSGSAGGYGYDKGSAAADTAIRAAGVKLSESINGRGAAAVREAVQAVGEALAAGTWPVYVVEMYA